MENYDWVSGFKGQGVVLFVVESLLESLSVGIKRYVGESEHEGTFGKESLTWLGDGCSLEGEREQSVQYAEWPSSSLERIECTSKAFPVLTLLLSQSTGWKKAKQLHLNLTQLEFPLLSVSLLSSQTYDRKSRCECVVSLYSLPE